MLYCQKTKRIGVLLKVSTIRMKKAPTKKPQDRVPEALVSSGKVEVRSGARFYRPDKNIR